jgi:hypothetical protein
MPGPQPSHDEVVVAVRQAGTWVLDLLRRPEVAAAWERPGALPGYSVGGIVAHLVVAVGRVDDRLDDPEPTDATVVDLAGFYAGNRVEAAADVATGRHAALVADGERRAEAGAAATVGALAAVLDRLAARLPDERPDRLVAVLNVRGGAAPLEAYLVSRAIELAVHGDDVAVSVGIDPPPLPTAVADVVLPGLLAAARDRVGDLRVLRALTRGERGDPDDLRVL